MDLNETTDKKLSLMTRHYLFLKHEKQTEIRVFSKGIVDTRVYIVTGIDEFLSIVKARAGEDLGVGVHERGTGGILDENVTSLKLICVDLDTKDDTIVEECEKKLFDAGLPFSAKIFTGQKGYHYYIPVEKIEGNDQIKEALENCKYYFLNTLKLPIDPRCFNPSRVFRIWGTMNKGKLVDIVKIDENVKPINILEKIPQRPDSANTSMVNVDLHYKSQVLEDFPLFEALYKNPNILPIQDGTNFNDVMVKNIAAYIQKKGTTDLTPWIKLMKRKNHPIANLTNWLKKPRFFNPFEIIANVRKYYPSLYKDYCIPLKQISSHSLSYIEDDEMKWDDLKKKHREANTFVINRQYKFESNINLIDEGKIIIKLAKVYQNLEDPNQYYNVYFDEPDFSKGLGKTKREELGVHYIGEINASFYIYTSKHNNVKIKIFSEEKIINGRYYMYGTLWKFNDSFLVGNKSTLSSYSLGMILHSYENKGLRYNSLEDLYEDIKISGDDMYRYIMTEVENIRVPTYYKTSDFWKTIYTAFIFSGCYNKGEKLNLIVLGPTGTGKTPHLNAISEKFGENKHYSGTSLSIPGLTISFYTDPFKTGALLESNRLCAIDEFFKIFLKMEDISEITKLNDYLDNQLVTASSGKQSVDVRSTCQILGVTNPIRKNIKNMGVRKLMTLIDMFDYVDSDFWGRFLIINQNKQDIDWVMDSSNNEKNVIISTITKDQFIACYDFFKNYNDVMNLYDYKRINQIVRSLQVPEKIDSVYKKICNRIPYLLFDGMIKWKMFSNKQIYPLIEEKDYVEFFEIWKEIITRWFYQETEGSISLLFSSKEQNILEKLKLKGTIAYDDFNALCEEEKVDYKDFKKRMLDTKIIRIDSNKRRIYYSNEIEILDEISEDINLNKYLD